MYVVSSSIFIEALCSVQCCGDLWLLWVLWVLGCVYGLTLLLWPKTGFADADRECPTVQISCRTDHCRPPTWWSSLHLGQYLSPLHYAPEILLWRSQILIGSVERDRTPKLLIQQLFSTRFTHLVLSSLEGQLMSSYIHAVAAKTLLTNARINKMIWNISIRFISAQDRRKGWCWVIERELELISLSVYQPREFPKYVLWMTNI